MAPRGRSCCWPGGGAVEFLPDTEFVVWAYGEPAGHRALSDPYARANHPRVHRVLAAHWPGAAPWRGRAPVLLERLRACGWRWRDPEFGIVGAWHLAADRGAAIEAIRRSFREFPAGPPGA